MGRRMKTQAAESSRRIERNGRGSNPTVLCNIPHLLRLKSQSRIETLFTVRMRESISLYQSSFQHYSFVSTSQCVKRLYLTAFKYKGPGHDITCITEQILWHYSTMVM